MKIQSIRKRWEETLPSMPIDQRKTQKSPINIGDLDIEISQKTEIMTSRKQFQPCPFVPPGEQAKLLDKWQRHSSKLRVLFCQKYVYYQIKQPVLSPAPSWKAMRFLLLDGDVPVLTFWTASLLELKHFAMAIFWGKVCIIILKLSMNIKNKINFALGKKDSRYYFHSLPQESAMVRWWLFITLY